MLEPVQGRFAGERGAVGAAGGELAGEHCQDGIVPDLVVVDQVLIAQSNPEHALSDQGCDLMLDALGIAGVGEAGGKAPEEMDGAIRGAK